MIPPEAPLGAVSGYCRESQPGGFLGLRGSWTVSISVDRKPVRHAAAGAVSSVSSRLERSVQASCRATVVVRTGARLTRGNPSGTLRSAVLGIVRLAGVANRQCLGEPLIWTGHRGRTRVNRGRFAHAANAPAVRKHVERPCVGCPVRLAGGGHRSVVRRAGVSRIHSAAAVRSFGAVAGIVITRHAVRDAARLRISRLEAGGSGGGGRHDVRMEKISNGSTINATLMHAGFNLTQFAALLAAKEAHLR